MISILLIISILWTFCWRSKDSIKSRFHCVFWGLTKKSRKIFKIEVLMYIFFLIDVQKSKFLLKRCKKICWWATKFSFLSNQSKWRKKGEQIYKTKYQGWQMTTWQIYHDFTKLLLLTNNVIQTRKSWIVLILKRPFVALSEHLDHH